MNSKLSATRRASRCSEASAITLLVGLAVAMHACSVYDESLKQGDGLAPTAGTADGGSSASSGADLGGGMGTLPSGGTGNIAGGDAIDAGAPGNGGDAGESSNGGSSNGGSSNGGSSNGGSSNGGSSNGGRAGAAGGSGGVVVAAGSAGVSTSGGNAGTAGAASELSFGKASSASTQQPANPSTSGNDGQTTTRWSATTATLPQWWRVDLGASHTLSQVSVQWEFADRKYTYAVETSADDSAYTTQANVVDGIGAVQVVPIPNHVSARYVRITCTSTVPGVDPMTGASRPTWASVWEVSVQGS